MRKFILIMVVALSLLSCAGVKKTHEKSTVTNQKEITSVTNDSVYNKEINKKIDDAVALLVTKSSTSDEAFNKAVDKAVDEILSKLNIKKQSGDNSYELYYDLFKRELMLRTQVGETKNEQVATSQTKSMEKSLEQQTDEYFEKKVSQIPWWLWAVGVVWLISQCMPLLRAFVPWLPKK